MSKYDDAAAATSAVATCDASQSACVSHVVAPPSAAALSACVASRNAVAAPCALSLSTAARGAVCCVWALAQPTTHKTQNASATRTNCCALPTAMRALRCVVS